MGEYARYKGAEIKIGTCESMYYLRDDQRHLIDGYDFAGCLGEIRFRFPFPDEDALEPGTFEDYDRGVRIPGAWTVPDDFEHGGSVQFKAEPGYLLSLPCPEAFPVPEGTGHADRQSIVDGTSIRIGRNGWHGGYLVKQQKHVDGALWTVVACGSCGDAWRLPREVAATVAEAFLDESERQEWRRGYDFEADTWLNSYGYEPAHTADYQAFLRTMAERILAGYTSDELARAEA